MGSLIRPKYEICCSCKKPIIAFPKGKDKSALKAPFSVAYSRSVSPHHAFRISNARFVAINGWYQNRINGYFVKSNKANIFLVNGQFHLRDDLVVAKSESFCFEFACTIFTAK